jgi:nitrite reductase (cytochrome c-552)
MGAEIVNPIGCADCHDPLTMNLTITRPGLIEAFQRQGKDIMKATPQEMRSLVCAQCHVEYYFKGQQKQLTFPWHKGLKADQILSYYEEINHKDWEHKISGAGVLKAQHPEFELYQQGIHARSGVSCVDCHMPYKRVGAMKITDHHVRSPVLNINNACQTCHRWPEKELKDRIETIQSRTFEMRGVALNALTEYINQIGEAKSTLESKEKLEKAQLLQKRAQFLLDFVEAENSMGFHAPGESLRLLGLSIDYTRQGQMVLQDAKKKSDKK